MPLVAVLGSFTAGFVSDKFFKGHRSPVAMTLYFVECAVILTAAFVIAAGVVSPTPFGIFIGCLFLVLVALTANSIHAIVGAAAPMDIGGRKMASFGAIGGLAMLMVMRKQRRVYAMGDARAMSR